METGVAQNQDKLEDLQRQAVDLFRNGKHEAAIALCHEIIKKQPNFARAYLTLGNFLQNTGKLEAALRAYYKALEIDSNLPPVYCNLGIIYRKQNQFDWAIKSYQKAIALNHNLPEVHFNLGNLLQSQGRSAEALLSFQEAILINPNWAEPYFRMATCFWDEGDVQNAIANYQKALQLNPNHTYAYSDLGTIFDRQGKLDEAVSCYQKSLAIQPNREEVYYYLSKVLLAQGQWEASNTYQQKALALNPNLTDAEYYFAIGKACIGQGELLEAMDYWIKALQIKPWFFFIYHNLAKILEKLNRPELAHLCSAIWLPNQVFQEFLKKDLPLTVSSKVSSVNMTYVSSPFQQDLSLSPPKTISNELHPNFHETCRKSPGLENTFVAIISNGRAWGDAFTNVVTTSAGDILEDLSIGSSALIATSEPFKKVVKLPGTAAFLSLRGGSSYYHWMIEVLPRLDLILNSGINFNDIDFFIVNNFHKPFQKETLKQLGIPPEKIIASEKRPSIQAERLLVPSVWLMPQWSCQFLREQFLEDLTDRKVTNYDRIYISRQQTTSRQILNEEEVLGLLTQFGFQPIVLESLSFREQVSCLASAKVVVAPHGAGLTNLVFCNPGTKVIELFSPYYVETCYWVLSNHLGLDYYYLMGEDRSSLCLHPGYGNISVNLDALLQLIEITGANNI